MQKKIIVFSLYGNDKVYINGAIENAKIALEIFPEWTCRFYIASDVDRRIVNILEGLGCDVYHKPQNRGVIGMFWRFEPLFEENTIMLSRDADSRLTLREKSAIDEWLESDFNFHIIRDHPKHGAKIMGGMFGSKNHRMLNRAQTIMSSFRKTAAYGDDQYFLSRIIYPIIRNTALIHSSGIYYDNEKIKPIKMPKVDYQFIGMSYTGKSIKNTHIDEIRHLHTTKTERLQVALYKIISLLNLSLNRIPSWILLENKKIR